jgi:hypothetical protein
MPSRRRTSRAEMPVIWMALFRLLGPETIVNEERGWPKSSARNSMQASLARPSAGGASKASLSASPVCPTIAIRRALGWTLTLRTIPCRFSRTTATGLFSNLPENMNDSCCRLLCLAHGLCDFVVYGFASVRLWIWLADPETRGRVVEGPAARGGCLLGAELSACSGRQRERTMNSQSSSCRRTQHTCRSVIEAER